jgi:hypothetical protein
MVITLNMSSVTPVLKVVSSSDQAPIDCRIVRLRDEWLDGFKSAETRRGYRGDHAAWLTFCVAHGIDPLAARRVDVNRWARALEAAGAKPRSVARRLAAGRAGIATSSTRACGRRRHWNEFAVRKSTTIAASRLGSTVRSSGGC